MKIKPNVRGALSSLVLMISSTIPMTSFAGATIYKDKYDSGQNCIWLSAGENYCFQQFGTWQQVTTPSGNTNYTMKGSVAISITSAGYTTKTTVDSSEKMLFKAGQLHVDHSFTTTNIVNAVSGQCTSYTTEYDYGFANGNVTQSNYTYSSTPC